MSKLKNKNLDVDISFNRSRTIDIRPLLVKKDEEIDKDIEFDEGENKKPYVPEIIVSQAKYIEERNKRRDKEEKENKELKLKWKYLVFRILLNIYKNIMISLIFLYQRLNNKLRALEWGGINFDKKYSEQTLYYLAISLPDTVKSYKDVLLYYPEFSKNNCYKLLKIRKDKIKMYSEVFNKK